MATGEDAVVPSVSNHGDGDNENSTNPSDPEGQGRRVRISLDPMHLLLGLLMTSGDRNWYKADRISRSKLEEKYPTACRFSKTDGNIAAIDFGTTFCSLAFATVGDPSLVDMSSVEINTISLNKFHPRVPTAILLKESSSLCNGSDESETVSTTCNYEVIAFGSEAVNKHSKLQPSERARHLYFERFKMTLQQDKVKHNYLPTYQYHTYIYFWCWPFDAGGICNFLTCTLDGGLKTTTCIQ